MLALDSFIWPTSKATSIESNSQLPQKRLRQYVNVHAVRLWECLLIRHLTRRLLSVVKLLLGHTVWNIQHLKMFKIMF